MTVLSHSGYLFFFMSNNIFPDFTSISTPLRHHTFIIRGALSKIIWPRASSPSFPTNLCAPRSHKRSSTYAPWLQSYKRGAGLEGSRELCHRSSLRALVHSPVIAKGLENTDLWFSLDKKIFLRRYEMSNIEQLFLYLYL